ncbi:MAG: hypothetical protein AB1758_06915 [Candidatus Eremiobacterota bacterium]
MAIREGIVRALYAIAYINLPNLWIVRAEPRLTSKEKKQKVAASTHSRFFPHKRVRHIVLDRHQLQEMRAADSAGRGEVSPHVRRAHWRRLPEGYRKTRTWVRETFVGDRTFSDARNVYEVLN